MSARHACLVAPWGDDPSTVFMEDWDNRSPEQLRKAKALLDEWLMRLRKAGYFNKHEPSSGAYEQRLAAADFCLWWTLCSDAERDDVADLLKPEDREVTGAVPDYGYVELSDDEWTGVPLRKTRRLLKYRLSTLQWASDQSIERILNERRVITAHRRQQWSLHQKFQEDPHLQKVMEVNQQKSYDQQLSLDVDDILDEMLPKGKPADHYEPWLQQLNPRMMEWKRLQLVEENADEMAKYENVTDFLEARFIQQIQEKMRERQEKQNSIETAKREQEQAQQQMIARNRAVEGLSRLERVSQRIGDSCRLVWQKVASGLETLYYEALFLPRWLPHKEYLHGRLLTFMIPTATATWYVLRKFRMMQTAFDIARRKAINREVWDGVYGPGRRWMYDNYHFDPGAEIDKLAARYGPPPNWSAAGKGPVYVPAVEPPVGWHYSPEHGNMAVWDDDFSIFDKVELLRPVREPGIDPDDPTYTMDYSYWFEKRYNYTKFADDAFYKFSRFDKQLLPPVLTPAPFPWRGYATKERRKDIRKIYQVPQKRPREVMSQQSLKDYDDYGW